MKSLRFNNNQPEWDTPLPELAPVVKKALRIQWREFIHEIEDGEALYNERVAANLAKIDMFERFYRAS